MIPKLLYGRRPVFYNLYTPPKEPGLSNEVCGKDMLVDDITKM